MKYKQEEMELAVLESVLIAVREYDPEDTDDQGHLDTLIGRIDDEDEDGHEKIYKDHCDGMKKFQEELELKIAALKDKLGISYGE